MPRRFREFALECTRRAEEARDERQRRAWLGLAARWLQAAVQVERSSIALLDDDPPWLDDDVPLVPKDDRTLVLRSRSS